LQQPTGSITILPNFVSGGNKDANFTDFQTTSLPDGKINQKNVYRVGRNFAKTDAALHVPAAL